MLLLEVVSFDMSNTQTGSICTTLYDMLHRSIASMGAFTVEVPLLGQRTSGLFFLDLGVYHDFLLFDQ